MASESDSPLEPLNPAWFPRRLEVDLSPELAEWLDRQVALTGRSPNELLVALLDQALRGRNDGELP
jgi:hypothetical protein